VKVRDRRIVDTHGDAGWVAAGTAYLVGTAKGFEVAIGFTAWRDVLAAAGVTAEANRQALADRTVTA
jgi:hypothetical protein